MARLDRQKSNTPHLNVSRPKKPIKGLILKVFLSISVILNISLGVLIIVKGLK